MIYNQNQSVYFSVWWTLIKAGGKYKDKLATSCHRQRTKQDVISTLNVRDDVGTASPQRDVPLPSGKPDNGNTHLVTFDNA